MNVIQTRACATGKSCCPVISCVRADSKHGRYETSRTCIELTNSYSRKQLQHVSRSSSRVRLLLALFVFPFLSRDPA
jgi:hypothetical protein